MGRVTFALGVALAITAMSAAADERFGGLSFASARASEGGATSSSFGITGVMSARPAWYYGIELQAGYFKKNIPLTNNVELDLAGVGFLPLGNSGMKLYAKGGLADVYSWAPSPSAANPTTSANRADVTYGAGLEFQRQNVVVRLSYQHFKLGKYAPASLPTANLVGLVFMGSY